MKGRGYIKGEVCVAVDLWSSPPAFICIVTQVPPGGSALRKPSQEMDHAVLVVCTAEMSGFRFPVVPRDNYHGWLCADGHALCRGQIYHTLSQMRILTSHALSLSGASYVGKPQTATYSFVLWFTGS